MYSCIDKPGFCPGFFILKIVLTKNQLKMKNRIKKTETPLLDCLKIEQTIAFVKQVFERELCQALFLHKVSAPSIVWQGSGINDDLNVIERAVCFPVKDGQDKQAEVVHSLAKWKRLRLMEYGIQVGEGILTDMRALRPDESLSAVHSISVDQFDWEKNIRTEDRNLDFLKSTVVKIYSALKTTESALMDAYPLFKATLAPRVQFFHAEELMQMYPNKSPKQREFEIAKQYGAVFIIGIGARLSDGQKHDGRAPDYDDWSSPTSGGFCGLNGDLVLWNPFLGTAFELSSMGIRVDKKSIATSIDYRKMYR
jgi:aspartate--ammonia ligase